MTYGQEKKTTRGERGHYFTKIIYQSRHLLSTIKQSAAFQRELFRLKRRGPGRYFFRQFSQHSLVVRFGAFQHME